MASILKVDEMQGVTSAGDITITSEGGAATMRLQQGLAKSWANATGNGATVNDSFNLASLTDTGTGNAFFNLTNNAANANYSLTGGGQISTTSGTGCFFHNVQGGASNGYQVQHFENAVSADPLEYTGVSLHGDLA